VLRRWLGNLALLAGALVFTFAVLELGVRLFVDLREEGPIAIRGIDPDHPLRFLPGFQTRYTSSEFDYSVSFNSYGRRDVEWTREQVEDPHSVIFIGDSFVLGNSVDHEFAVPTLVEAELARAGDPREVMNFGMPAAGPPAYLALLEDTLGQGFAADTIVVGIFVGNDFYPTVPKAAKLDLREKPARRQPGLHSELLRFLKLRVSQSSRLVGWTLAASGAMGITLYDTAGSYIFLRRKTPDQAALFERVLGYVGRIQEICAADGRRLLLVIFPNRIQVENGDDLTSMVFDAALPDRLILDYCARRGITCLDLLPVLEAAHQEVGQPLYFSIDRHMNERGNQIAARAIGAFLLENDSRP
jgi:hypothetical protein